MQDKLIQRVKQNILNKDMINNEDILVVGVSGGKDSIFILHALLNLQEEIKREKNISYTIEVAHINHMIRQEAAFDEELVSNYAKNNNLPIHILREDVEAKANVENISTELCGRNVRYDFFSKVKANRKNVKIVTAHNAGDNAETILFNIIRGTSLDGLCGIKEKAIDVNRQMEVIRPILNITAKEIIDYLNKNNISYAEDRTNSENIYTRNKIRNDLIKKIEREYNPNIISTLNRMAGNLVLDNQIVLKAVDNVYNQIKKEIKKDKIIIDSKLLLKESNGMKKRIIRKILIELFNTSEGIESIHIEDIVKLIANNITNKQYIIGNKYKVVIEKKYRVVFKILAKQ